MRVKNGALTLEHAYKKYKEKYPVGHKNYVDKKTYKTICYTYNKEISRMMIEEGEDIRLPFRLSIIGIRKYKTDYSKPVFDYHYYNTTGKKAFIINEHSDDYTAFFYWRKNKALVKGRRYYNFKPVRGNSRDLGKIMKIKNGHKRYSTKYK